MEGFWLTLIIRSCFRCFALFFLVASFGCSAKILQSEQKEELTVEEFDKKVDIEPLKDPVIVPVEEPEKKEEVSEKVSKKKVSKNKKMERKKKSKSTVKVSREEKIESSDKAKKTSDEKEEDSTDQVDIGDSKPAPHLPEIEDGEGFDGRRPLIDPFRVGEKVRLSLTYFGVSAGHVEVGLKPFVRVNGRKAYNFYFSAISSKLFSMFYKVEDYGDSYLDYDTMQGLNYSLHVRESKQLREIRSYFDWENNYAYFWEKKITQKEGRKEKEKRWKIEPYTQNLFSAIFYMRAFTLKVGKTIQFRMADDGKVMIVSGRVLRREKITTTEGEFDTWVIEPRIKIGGMFKQTGKIRFWLTADDRKFLVKFTSEIRIGKIVGKLRELVK